MKKLVIILAIAIVMITGILVSTKSAPHMADTVKDETIRGDIVELQGKSMFFRDKYGDYPIHSDNVYDLSESKVIWGVKVLEEFFANTKTKEGEAKAYMEEHVKLIDLALMKSKGITYELANKKSIYFLDTKTGMVLNPDLIESGDEDYIGELEDNDGMYRPMEKDPIIITDGVKTMKNVQGSLRSGSKMYFYGGPGMVLAVRNELTNEIVDVGAELEAEGITEILYIQTKTKKAAVIVGGVAEVREIELK